MYKNTPRTYHERQIDQQPNRIDHQLVVVERRLQHIDGDMDGTTKYAGHHARPHQGAIETSKLFFFLLMAGVGDTYHSTFQGMFWVV